MSVICLIQDIIEVTDHSLLIVAEHIINIFLNVGRYTVV